MRVQLLRDCSIADASATRRHRTDIVIDIDELLLKKWAVSILVKIRQQFVKTTRKREAKKIISLRNWTDSFGGTCSTDTMTDSVGKAKGLYLLSCFLLNKKSLIV